MADDRPQASLTPLLVDSLYSEAMELADEARGYFEKIGQWDRKRLEPMDRVVFSCESLKVTTRIMHVISWLLVRKAVAAGEMSEADADHPDRKLGRASISDERTDPRLSALPSFALTLIRRSQDLYERVHRLEEQMHEESAAASPARQLLDRLERAF